MANLDRRATLFPRSKPAANRNLSKRSFTEIASHDKRSGKLRRLVPVRGLFKKAVEDPWKRYNRIFEYDQAGPGTLVHINNDSFEEFVVRSKAVNNKDCLEAIKECSHKNVVRLQEALYDNGNIFFIYEVMEVSLAHIFVTPLGRLKPYEVATFCADIMHGLDYLHNSLQLVHGEVNAENVLLSTNGAIKLANIGSSMLREPGQRSTQDDTWGVGKLILMCLEPGTFLKNCEDLEEDWNSDLIAFHKLTKIKPYSKMP
ncbi:Hypothetical protein PENO1_109810 [Penicillium occitanis (nom. inval.)]|nr:Hypothetical protein PENO1_109810 [Penicillium occitanis (nom. inval.)]